MAAVTLYHDGCSICLGIAQRFASTPGLSVEIVDLSIERQRALDAQSFGITRLPSLVINGQVMRLEDHSSIQHVL